jgi:hypothetical protein
VCLGICIQVVPQPRFETGTSEMNVRRVNGTKGTWKRPKLETGTAILGATKCVSGSLRHVLCN